MYVHEKVNGIYIYGLGCMFTCSLLKVQEDEDVHVTAAQDQDAQGNDSINLGMLYFLLSNNYFCRINY